jgi:hypothetical protein
MMREPTSISELPNAPGVYAMYGGRGRGLHVAYVGVAGNLKRRVMQHLVRRDSSVATGTSAVTLNPDYVTEVRWWEHPDFADRHFLEAAELVASNVLDPVLRSRGNVPEKAKQLHADENFCEKMRSLLLDKPTGRLVISTLQDVLERIAELERQLAEIERHLSKNDSGE